VWRNSAPQEGLGIDNIHMYADLLYREPATKVVDFCRLLIQENITISGPAIVGWIMSTRDAHLMARQVTG